MPVPMYNPMGSQSYGAGMQDNRKRMVDLMMNKGMPPGMWGAVGRAQQGGNQMMPFTNGPPGTLGNAMQRPLPMPIDPRFARGAVPPIVGPPPDVIDHMGDLGGALLGGPHETAGDVPMFSTVPGNRQHRGNELPSREATKQLMSQGGSIPSGDQMQRMLRQLMMARYRSLMRF